MTEKETTVSAGGFTATPKGKALIMGIAFVLVGLVLFVPFYAYLGSRKAAREGLEAVKATANQTVTKTSESGAKGVPGSVETKPVEDDKVAPTEDDVPESVEVYEFRDPFKPLDVPEAAEESVTSASTGTQTSSGSQTVSSVALSVEDIYTEDGIAYATIHYGSTIYQVKAGDNVGETPYQVQAIGEDSVTLLYGDDEIALKVGEEIIK